MSEQDGLIREVNEAMRQEQLSKLVSSVGKYVMLFTGIIILATICYVWMQTSKQRQYEDATLQLYEAMMLMKDGKSYQAREQFDALSESSFQSVAMLADMWRVKLKMTAGKPEEAAELVSEAQIKYSTAALRPYHDWFVLYKDDVPEPDNASAYRMTLHEKLASAALQAGNPEEAARHYLLIANSNDTPSTMRERANYLLSTYFQSVVKAQIEPVTEDDEDNLQQQDNEAQPVQQDE
jgi:hypothetical protein